MGHMGHPSLVRSKGSGVTPVADEFLANLRSTGFVELSATLVGRTMLAMQSAARRHPEFDLRWRWVLTDIHTDLLAESLTLAVDWFETLELLKPEVLGRSDRYRETILAYIAQRKPGEPWTRGELNYRIAVLRSFIRRRSKKRRPKA